MLTIIIRLKVNLIVPKNISITLTSNTIKIRPQFTSKINFLSLSVFLSSFLPPLFILLFPNYFLYFLSNSE
jgi:hypothetical protein